MINGAERLFQEIDIPIVWMEWVHVKGKEEYGGPSIMAFMRKHKMAPYNLMKGHRLLKDDYLKWPFTVLWRKETL